MMDAAVEALNALVETIEATGGLTKKGGEGELVPVGDEERSDLADAYLLACKALDKPPMTDGDPSMADEKTWTFCGHWEEDRIVVEYVLDGEVEDDREDTGHWPEGLWAASGSGRTVDEAQAAVVAEYESEVR